MTDARRGQCNTFARSGTGPVESSGNCSPTIPQKLTTFARRFDRPGLSVYASVNPLLPGSRQRNNDTVAAVVCLHADIDLRTLATPHDAVLADLRKLARQLPVEVRESGGGFHVLIWLKEPAERDTAEFARADALRARLIHILSADPSQRHASAILRQLGTHNTKYGTPRECRTIIVGKPVDITEVEDFLDALGDAPRYQPIEKPRSNGHDHSASTAVPADGPVNVEQRLADMQFKGGDSRSIHLTELQCAG